MSKVSKTFASHKLTGDSMAKVDAMRVSLTAIEDYLREVLPSGRLTSVAMTQFEIAGQMIIKALTHEDPANRPVFEVLEPKYPFILIKAEHPVITDLSDADTGES